MAGVFHRDGKNVRPKNGITGLGAATAKPLCLCAFVVKLFSMKPLTMHTGKLTDAQAAALQAALVARNWQPRTVPYARFAFESDKTNLVFYESGKLVVQGKGTQEFVEFVLEPEILQQAKLGYETVLNPDLLLPRFGVDESGKEIGRAHV